MPLPLPELNKEARFSGLTIGRFASTIVIIDDVLANAEAIAGFGRNEADYAPPATLYPGLNAHLPEAFAVQFASLMRPVLASAYDIPRETQLHGQGYFGLVTLKPEALSPGQSIPHVDIVGNRGLAAVLYLCEEDQGGTGYYRHRSTGFERLTGDNIMTYNSVLQSETARHLPPAYPLGDHALFERIGKTDARFNRMVIYNGNLLHSGQIHPERLNADPAQGRLTLNLFMGYG